LPRLNLEKAVPGWEPDEIYPRSDLVYLFPGNLGGSSMTELSSTTRWFPARFRAWGVRMKLNQPRISSLINNYRMLAPSKVAWDLTIMEVSPPVRAAFRCSRSAQWMCLQAALYQYSQAEAQWFRSQSPARRFCPLMLHGWFPLDLLPCVG
jgi:hypothetical protein